MQLLLVLCWALMAPVGADECPGGGSCEVGHTCCNNPGNGYECCPFDQAECCGDHIHCCPAETICDSAKSSCVNATVSIPWVERAPADQPRLSKSFRMIKTYMGEEDDNVCPDQSRCPPEFSCLRALTKFGCCPLAQGVPCSDGKHCCPEDHQCSADGRSCIKQEFVKTVLCDDGVSECPDGTTCCENPEGKWGCCPLPKAVCCEDKMYCCPEGTKCDVEHSKCIQTSTRKEMPMWAKLPARIRAEWENQKEGDRVTAEAVDDGSSEKVPEVTTVPPSERETSSEAAAGVVPCSDKVACPDNTTCCKNAQGGWNCCPYPEAVCCEDFSHCCPHGMRCNLAAMTCDDDTCSVPLVKKTPAIPRRGVQAGNVTCDSTYSCSDGSTCCKNKTGGWACCPLAEAVCCDDHEHCCPADTTCNLATLECEGSSGSTTMLKKTPAFAGEATAIKGAAEHEEDKGPVEEENEEENEEAEGMIQCDPHTSCPQSATCCFMSSSQRWGCCPLPEAVCCADGNHCCPTDYKCDESETTCVKGELVIPWYTKLPATSSVQADPSAVQCDDLTQCPESTTCCQLATGEWGCCSLQNAVCCPDKQHCCPEGYTCDITSNSCQKLVTLQLETAPLTPVYLPGQQPRLRGVKCDDQTSCDDGQTCCRTSETTWGCCPFPDAVCCSDLVHCCPTGYTCTQEGDCIQSPRWYNWHIFLANTRRAQIV